MKKCFFLKIGLICSVFVSVYAYGLSIEEIDDVFTFAEVQYAKATDTLSVELGMPRNGHSDGSWEQVPIKDWTSGFFPGCLWYIYENNQEADWLAAAEEWTAPLEPLKSFDLHHDVGFMVFCSYGNGYRLTKKPMYKEVILSAADALATRYRPSGEIIQSWGNVHRKETKTFRVIIDNMMNLELLLWAADHGGDQSLREIAFSHADTTSQNHFRPDNSTYHKLTYDLETGDVVLKQTHQGYADDSMWARGQGWAIYGYTMMFRETENPAYLAIAEKAAAIYLKRLPEDGVPRWDFDAPEDKNYKDASAAAIVSSALIDLYQLTGKPSYLEQSEKTLAELSTDRYLANGEEYQCLLLHSVGNLNKNSEVDVNINYADYYFLEALTRLKRIKQDNVQ